MAGIAGPEKSYSLESQYAVCYKIGSGGCGSVDSCRRLSDGQLFAIKRIKEDDVTYWTRPEDGTRIPLEVRMLELVSDISGCIKMHDYFYNTRLNEWCIVMEMIELVMDLLTYVTRRGSPLPEDDVLFYFEQIVSTAVELKEIGVVHGDIKEENILLDQKTGQIKFIDFGASDFLEAYKYQCKGTELCLPPEWHTDGEYDPESATVWSLGVLLFGMTANEYPFENNEDIMKASPVYPTNVNMSSDLRDLLDRLLSQNPSNRPTLVEILSHPWFSDS